MAWNWDEERKAGKNIAVASGVFALVFAVCWCAIAWVMGAYIMLLFGVPFAGFMAYRLYVLLRMAKGQQHQSPSPEPWERPSAQPEGKTHCPYCGAALGDGFAYCPHCGRRL